MGRGAAPTEANGPRGAIGAGAAAKGKGTGDPMGLAREASGVGTRGEGWLRTGAGSELTVIGAGVATERFFLSETSTAVSTFSLSLS